MRFKQNFSNRAKINQRNGPHRCIRSVYAVSIIALFIACALSIGMQTSAAGVKTYGTDYFPNEYAQGSIDLTWNNNTIFNMNVYMVRKDTTGNRVWKASYSG